MGVCATCGNHYDKSFDVTMGGETFTFDSFECAAARLAPVCGACGVRVLGHGVESDGAVYCCAHCAGRAGAEGLRDRAT